MAMNDLKVNSGAAKSGFDPAKIDVIRNTVAKGADHNELEMFLHLAAQYNLDPLAKEIWFIKRPKKIKDRGNWDYKRNKDGSIDYTGAETVIMTSRDGYVKIAHGNPDFEELNSMEIRENDDFLYNAFTKEIKHNIGANRGKITGAWALCKRKGMEPAFIHVDFQEYRDAVGKSNTWDKYPSAMIRKIAEVIVLKRQFNISGLVTSEEMQADFSIEYTEKPEPPKPRKDITPKEEPAKVVNLQEHQEQKQQRQQESSEDYKAAWIAASRKLKNKMELMNVNPEDAKILFTSSLNFDPNIKKWTLGHLDKALDFLNDLSKSATYDHLIESFDAQDPGPLQMRKDITNVQ